MLTKKNWLPLFVEGLGEGGGAVVAADRRMNKFCLSENADFCKTVPKTADLILSGAVDL